MMHAEQIMRAAAAQWERWVAPMELEGWRRRGKTGI
jgi:hypothetical protein